MDVWRAERPLQTPRGGAQEGGGGDISRYRCRIVATLLQTPIKRKTSPTDRPGAPGAVSGGFYRAWD